VLTVPNLGLDVVYCADRYDLGLGEGLCPDSAFPGSQKSSTFLLTVPKRGMRHTSTALYFYGASKKSLHKPRATFGNMFFQICYGFNYYLQLLLSGFFSKSHLNF
jgi:hypothetical protein